MKRVLALFLTLALIITLLPAYGPSQKVAASGTYFIFPNENDTRASARVVSSQIIQLEGLLNNVVGSSISYRVEQIPNSGSETPPLNRTEEITTGIMSTGDNRVTVSSIILFPGMNKITFKGVSGTSTVEEFIYIEFRDNPMLYDLKIQFENRGYDVLETEPTMLYSTSPTTQSSGQIVITGNAPNATKVTIDINGRTYDFNVSTASNSSRFGTSQLTINKGMNIIKFKVHNAGQVVETTRQVAFYNGEVTYYDLKIMEAASVTNAKSESIEQRVEFGTSVNTGVRLTGKAIIPLPLYDLTQSPSVPVGLNDPTAVQAALQALFTMERQNDSAVYTPTTLSYTPSTITDATQFLTVSFVYTIASQIPFDTLQSVRFKAPNLSAYNQSLWYQYTLRNSSLAYIYDINYLSGFNGSMTTATSNTYRTRSLNDTRILNLQSTDISSGGVDVYSVPMGVEILIGNYQALGGNYADIIKLATSPSSTNLAYKMIHGSATNDDPLTQVVTQTVNGQTVSYLRLFVEVQRLPRSGSNTLHFNLDATNATAAITPVTARLLYGPYVKFDTIVNGFDAKHDSVMGNDTQLLTKLGDFKGQLYNIVNNDEVRYAPVAATGTTPYLPQTVFLYLNNVEVELQAVSSANPASFMPRGWANGGDNSAIVTQISRVLNKAGENTLKFVFISENNNYESILRFNIVPQNLPEAPKAGTDGVYPYSNSVTWPPLPNDPRFPRSGSVYTTQEAEYNVFGTFDFLDLGTSESLVSGQLGNISDPSVYAITISSPNWSTEVKWDLNTGFELLGANRTRTGVLRKGGNQTEIPTGNTVGTIDAQVNFYYDMPGQYFAFDIRNQKMPEDGSAQVYVITVFNAGPNGPRATYRLEVNPISIPYTIKSPVMEERTTNRNFVEVIITSPGADSIVINKIRAEKITYREHGAGPTGEIQTEAFRAIVKDIRPNRDTKIQFEITRGQDTIKQELTVKYVPTNIPGAQMLETMKASHKLFNNELTLTFPRNAQLIRPGYNDPNGHATQVYNSNEILFAITNPNDGIVNRHLYEGQPPNYSANNQAEGNLHIGYRFQDQARQFIKASPLFWIDAGLADDPNTTNYDPHTAGLDPFPFPNYVGKETGTFTSRWNRFDRELMPSVAGQLTLTYDSNVVQSAGTTITVFRFDPYNSTWENIGGVVDEKKRTVTVPFTKFGYYVAVKLTRGFNDITDHPRAREAMEAIFSKGIMNAIDPIGLFGGDRFVTRGEFTRMIVRALELPLNYQGDHHFSYYPETITNANNASAIYDYRYIETAARAGIVNGKRPGFFDEDLELSRQEAATILARALQLKLETNSTKAKNDLDKVFKDSGTFDFYSIPSVLAIQKKGFIQGKPVNPLDSKEGYVFDPRARLLRSDAAIIMARVMNDMKKLPKIYN